MEMTLREIAEILNPPMTQAQISVLTVIAGIRPSGKRRTGKPGHPAAIYDTGAVMRAHGEEASRTVKQFTDNDWIASALLARNLIRVSTEAGELWWPDGTRAERPASSLYGYVHAGPRCVAAHRVIWIAADGEIPAPLQVNHINKRRWDNRRANLELVTFGNNIRHAHGHGYLTYHDAVSQLAELEPSPPAPANNQRLIRVGGAFRHATDWPTNCDPR